MARLHWTYMYETKTADELNENCKFTLCQQVALIEQQKYSLVCRCKQSSARLINTTLICIIQWQDEKKIASTLFQRQSVPPKVHINFHPQLYRDSHYISNIFLLIFTGSGCIYTSLIIIIILFPEHQISILEGFCFFFVVKLHFKIYSSRNSFYIAI